MWTHRQFLNMQLTKNSIIVFLSFLIIFGCTTVKDVKMIYNKAVEPTYVTLNDKSIILTPIVHFGQVEFFDKLKDSIATWKAKGYTVFYEEINIGPHERNIPAQEYEIFFRKFRKMVGGGASRESYGELSETFEGGITQPTYTEISLDSLDFNADVTIKEFVDEYERLYGQLELDSCDLQTPLDSAFYCAPLTNDMDPVIDDFRNRMLVKQIVESEQKKIVVIYGAYHIKPVEKALKSL
jgi:hypothetical protein